MTHPLLKIPASFHAGKPYGITSVCSAHPVVIEAALRLCKENDQPALIEATCNQVNQEGGYTGMTPADFRAFVEQIARKVDFPIDRIILGGDHLGPNPWKNLDAEEAMNKAEAMVAEYAKAGFTKLHLDTSMGCADEPVALPDEITAERAARLAVIAEKHKGSLAPVYVIGTEVPVPGGAVEELDHLVVTSPKSVEKTYSVHQEAFSKAGADSAFERVIALVVQPGVEFGHKDVIHYAPEEAKPLSQSLRNFPGIVFEAHSTDYQTEKGLSALVRDGFSILKVGPWLTFALREALYALDAIADILEGIPPQGKFMAEMELVMTTNPNNWKKYYEGDDLNLWIQRHFSYSDRIRYYWPEKQSVAAVKNLHKRLAGKNIPRPIMDQYLPGIISYQIDEIMIEAVQKVLKRYANATIQKN